MPEVAGRVESMVDDGVGGGVCVRERVYVRASVHGSR